MNAARPIKPEEYQRFRSELYKASEQLGREVLVYEVSLDTDPTLQPKNINEKLSRVQSYKDRVVAILNRAILAEAYWKAVAGKLQSKWEAEFARAMITEDVSKAKNSETREAMAGKIAGEKVVMELFAGKGTYEDHKIAVNANHADATAFYREVENIHENLQSAGMNLALQIKSVMINTKVFAGEDIGEETRPGGAQRHQAGALTIGG